MASARSLATALAEAFRRLRSGLGRVLRSEKAPSGFMLLVGLMGWGITRLDQVLKSPALEYTKSIAREAGEERAVCLVRNISIDRTYRGLRVILFIQDKPGASITDPRIEWTDPTGPDPREKEGPVSNKEDPLYALFPIPNLDAGCEVKLTAKLEGVSEFRLRIWSGEEDAIRPVETNLFTWMARHQPALILTFVGVCSLLTLRFLCWLGRPGGPGK